MTYIREATDTDRDNIVLLINAAFRVESFFVDGDRTDSDKVSALFKSGKFLLIDDGSKLVGCIYVELRGASGYFGLLSVDPPRQGQGVGGMLISDVLGRADTERLPVYLETLKARNVPFYEKHGFVVREHFNCHGGRGPETWTMLREPR